MPDKALVYAVTFVIFIATVVYMVEFFLPISKNISLKTECRKALLQMEIDGGLSSVRKDSLKSDLEALDFSNVTITAPTVGSKKQGEDITLIVDVDYVYSKFAGLFTRSDVTQHMKFEKTTCARKVSN